jgi:hypothetical protein
MSDTENRPGLEKINKTKTWLFKKSSVIKKNNYNDVKIKKENASYQFQQ